jgi:hypothetical protein
MFDHTGWMFDHTGRMFDHTGWMFDHMGSVVDHTDAMLSLQVQRSEVWSNNYNKSKSSQLEYQVWVYVCTKELFGVHTEETRAHLLTRTRHTSSTGFQPVWNAEIQRSRPQLTQLFWKIFRDRCLNMIVPRYLISGDCDCVAASKVYCWAMLARPCSNVQLCSKAAHTHSVSCARSFKFIRKHSQRIGRDSDPCLRSHGFFWLWVLIKSHDQTQSPHTRKGKSSPVKYWT